MEQVVVPRSAGVPGFVPDPAEAIDAGPPRSDEPSSAFSDPAAVDQAFLAVAGRAEHQDVAVMRVQAILESRHAEGLALHELAREVGLGLRGLEQRFRRATGRSVWDYLMHRRIDAALEAMRSRRTLVLTETSNR